MRIKNEKNEIIGSCKRTATETWKAQTEWRWNWGGKNQIKKKTEIRDGWTQPDMTISKTGGKRFEKKEKNERLSVELRWTAVAGPEQISWQWVSSFPFWWPFCNPWLLVPSDFSVVVSVWQTRTNLFTLCSRWSEKRKKETRSRAEEKIQPNI